jgi:hypothetical protein
VPFTEPSVVKSRGSRIRTHFECIQLGHNMAIKSGSRAPALSFTPVHPAHNNRRTNPSSEVRRWHRTGMHLIRYRGAINHFTVNFHGRARARVGSAVRCAGCAASHRPTVRGLMGARSHDLIAFSECGSRPTRCE